MASLRPISKPRFGNLNLSLDSAVSLSPSPPAFGILPPPPGFAPPEEHFGPFNYGRPFSAAVMKPFCDDGGNNVPSMMQSAPGGGEQRFDGGVIKNAQRPFNEVSSGYLDYMTESLWNGAFESALNLSTVSSDSFISGSESAEPPRYRPLTPLSGRSHSFFGDFGIARLMITPTKEHGNHSFGGFHQEKKAATERKPPRPKTCSYCKGPHQVKDKHGVTICPELRTLKCPVCSNKNPDYGHTVRFCPQVRMKRALVMQQEREAAMLKSTPVLPNKEEVLDENVLDS